MTPTLAAVLAALSSGTATAVVAHFLGRRRARADIAAILTTAAGALVAELRNEVDRLTTRLDASRAEADALSVALVAARAEVATLTTALAAARAELARLTPTAPKE